MSALSRLATSTATVHSTSRGAAVTRSPSCSATATAPSPPNPRIALPQNAQAAIAVADTDGDSQLDIVASAPQGLQTLLGNGDGTFRTGPATMLLGVLSDLAPARLDGDAIVDLVVADATPAAQRTVALLGAGDGSFVESGSAPVGGGPEAVIVTDLDGDGDDDVISVDSFSFVTGVGASTITVLRGDGRGGLAVASHPPVVRGPVSGAAGDLDADGDIDVAVSGVAAAALTVYAGDGAGRPARRGAAVGHGVPADAGDRRSRRRRLARHRGSRSVWAVRPAQHDRRAAELAQ